MTGQHVDPGSKVFETMAVLALDVSFFTSEFPLCDKVAEYLADILAQSHEDPARYANFSSMLVNEMVELAFRSVGPIGKIDFSLLKNQQSVRLCSRFQPDRNARTLWQDFGNDDAASDKAHPAHHLLFLADAIRLNVHAEPDGDDHVVLRVDFAAREGVR